jgi:hypothetical protein
MNPIITIALGLFPNTNAADWREEGGAAIHKDCIVGNSAKFKGPAICRGGTIWGGTIEGGTIKKTPLLICGLCEFVVCISKPGHISVGCETHTPDDWRRKVAAIGRKNGVDEEEQARVMVAVEIAAQWLIDNPDAVVEEEKAPEEKVPSEVSK